jgi:hypothetical protein
MVISRVRLSLCVLSIASFAVTASAQQRSEPFTPQVGQPGKDVVWVPTPSELVEKMLDLAKVTPQDFVVDLGSGDGRNVIGAAKRGARALGVEYNPDMVELSKRNATTAGVGDKATFVQGDMFESDFSQATVLALFLLPSNMLQLKPKFLALKPGTRIVSNTFSVEGWTPDYTETIGGDCASWCTALLWIVPAKVAGTWRLPQGQLKLTQDYQMVSGTLTSGAQSTQLTGKLVGDQLTMTGGGQQYLGRVSGTSIHITPQSGSETTWVRTGD